MIYEFECLECKQVFSINCSISEVDKVKKNLKCIYCGSKEVKQILYPSSFILRGDGWYKSGGY